MKYINEEYPFVETGAIGQSAQKRNLYYLRLGKGPHEIFYNAAHHSLEWITSLLLMRFVFDWSNSYIKGDRLGGYDVRDIAERASIYIVPMVNPDGIELVLHGGEEYAKTWQANSRGVDLNHNYDADWERCHSLEIAAGILGPGPTRYGGKSAFSEPETRAVADFCRRHDFLLSLALHSQGEEIYWDFEGLEPPSAEDFAKALSLSSGYAVSSPVALASCAGFKDWFIQEFRRYGFTIEVGYGKNPLPLSQFKRIYKDILEMLLICVI